MKADLIKKDDILFTHFVNFGGPASYDEFLNDRNADYEYLLVTKDGKVYQQWKEVPEMDRLMKNLKEELSNHFSRTYLNLDEDSPYPGTIMFHTSEKGSVLLSPHVQPSGKIEFSAIVHVEDGFQYISEGELFHEANAEKALSVATDFTKSFRLSGLVWATPIEEKSRIYSSLINDKLIIPIRHITEYLREEGIWRYDHIGISLSGEISQSKGRGTEWEVPVINEPLKNKITFEMIDSSLSMEEYLKIQNVRQVIESIAKHTVKGTKLSNYFLQAFSKLEPAKIKLSNAKERQSGIREEVSKVAEKFNISMNTSTVPEIDVTKSKGIHL